MQEMPPDFDNVVSHDTWTLDRVSITDLYAAEEVKWM